MEAQDWEEEAAILRAALGLPEGGTALDCACEWGRQTIVLVKLGWQVTVTDTALSSLKFARQRARSAGVNLEFRRLRFFVDSTQNYTVTRAAVGGNWVFDHPFFILLYLGVSGTFDGDPASDAIFPATLLVDRVRVFAREVVLLPVVRGAP
jgi:hypothetical protein